MGKYDRPCNWTTSDGKCGATPTKQFMNGIRCVNHTPSALQGKPEPKPDPERTLRGLREQAGIPNAPAAMSQSTPIDDAAIRSGKRRATPGRHREARQRIEQGRQQ